MSNKEYTPQFQEEVEMENTTNSQGFTVADFREEEHYKSKDNNIASQKYTEKIIYIRTLLQFYKHSSHIIEKYKENSKREKDISFNNKFSFTIFSIIIIAAAIAQGAYLLIALILILGFVFASGLKVNESAFVIYTKESEQLFLEKLDKNLQKDFWELLKYCKNQELSLDEIHQMFRELQFNYCLAKDLFYSEEPHIAVRTYYKRFFYKPFTASLCAELDIAAIEERCNRLYHKFNDINCQHCGAENASVTYLYEHDMFVCSKCHKEHYKK